MGGLNMKTSHLIMVKLIDHENVHHVNTYEASPNGFRQSTNKVLNPYKHWEIHM